MGEKELIDMNKKFYEDPELIVFETVEDIITASSGAPGETEAETENNDWGSVFVPFWFNPLTHSIKRIWKFQTLKQTALCYWTAPNCADSTKNTPMVKNIKI